MDKKAMPPKAEIQTVIDVDEMAARYGMEKEDVYKPDGTFVARDYHWKPEILPQAVQEVKARAAGQSVVKFVNHCPNWAIAAFAAAIRPATCFMNVGPQGMFNMYHAPFPVGDRRPACDLYFASREEKDRIYLTVESEGDPHFFDIDKMPLVTVPRVEPDRFMLLSGLMTHPMAINTALAYADTAKAFFIRFHEAPEYVCCLTNSEEYKIGDTIPVE